MIFFGSASPAPSADWSRDDSIDRKTWPCSCAPGDLSKSAQAGVCVGVPGRGEAFSNAERRSQLGQLAFFVVDSTECCRRASPAQQKKPWEIRLHGCVSQLDLCPPKHLVPNDASLKVLSLCSSQSSSALSTMRDHSAVCVKKKNENVSEFLSSPLAPACDKSGKSCNDKGNVEARAE